MAIINLATDTPNNCSLSGSYALIVAVASYSPFLRFLLNFAFSMY